MTPNEMAAMSDRFGRALLGADGAELDRLLAPDFTIWYNFSDATLDRAQAMTFFTSYFVGVKSRYRDIRLLPTPEGWVQQHRVDADGPDGFHIEGLPTIIVFTVEGDRIKRIEEYMDSAQTSGFDSSQMTA